MAAAASSASITVTYKTLPSATQANVWLRWPYLVVCDGGLVQVFDAHTPAEGSRSAGDEAGSVGDSFLQCVHQFSLARYHVGAAATGRGANVLHGLDVRAGCLVGGTASGLVLHVVLPPSGGSLPTPLAGAEPKICELAGHTKVSYLLCRPMMQVARARLLHLGAVPCCRWWASCSSLRTRLTTSSRTPRRSTARCAARTVPSHVLSHRAAACGAWARSTPQGPLRV